MQYELFPYTLKFTFPFKLAHSYRTSTPCMYLKLLHNAYTGWGEAVFPPYYPENVNTFKAFMEQIKLPEYVHDLDIGAYIEKVGRHVPGNTFAKAALDMALHNLKYYAAGISVQHYYHLPVARVHSSFTIGIAPDNEIKEKLQAGQSFQYYKLKVNESEIGRIINTYVSLSDKPFVVDANQGFSDPAEALKWCNKLKKYGALYIEQPFLKEDLQSHGWLKQRSPLPVIADESFQSIEDLDRVKDYFDGINIKLMKCGGIAAAYHIFQKARRLNMKTVMGCMAESSLAIQAARNLAPLATWADLDGNYLLENDPFLHSG